MKNFDTDAEKKAFELGAEYQKQYIGFCTKNYPYQLNLGGIKRFFNDFVNYVNGYSYIPNTDNNISFKDFCKKYTITE